MPSTLTVECPSCGEQITFAEPADDAWEPVLEGSAGFGDGPKVVGQQVTVRCPVCGHRTVIDRKDVTS